MINTMAYLLAISICGIFKLRARYDRICSWLMFFALFFLFIDACSQNALNQLAGFSIQWGETQLGRIKLDFYPTSVTNQILLPIFFVSVWAILNNNIFRFEEKRCAFNSGIILNFMTVSLLFCATNYVQLITMVFVSDIIGYMLLKNAEISRRYVIYNFFADMCLFMILALACGKIQSIEMTRLLGYEEIGRHKDFVSLVTAFALFIKMGIFPFQGYLKDISSARFQRMLAVNLLGSPLAGMLLLLKLQNLVLVSDFFIPTGKVILFISFIIGITNFTLQKRIEIKTTYFTMAMKSLLLVILIEERFNWNISLALYFIFMYLFNQLFFEIYMCQGRYGDKPKNTQIDERNVKQLKIILLEETISWSIWLILIWNIGTDIDNQNIGYGALMLLLCIGLFLSYIYQKRSQTLLSNSKQRVFVISTAVCLTILCSVGYMLAINWGYITVISLVFLGVIILPWYKFLNKIYQKEQTQAETRKFLPDMFVRPITSVSKIFQLFLDVFFAEKIITASVNFIGRQSVGLFLKINKKRYIINLLGIILGYLIFIAAFIVGER